MIEEFEENEKLVDIRNVHINTDLPPKERIADYIKQVGNPYCYLCEGMKVTISFAGKKTINDCIKDALATM